MKYNLEIKDDITHKRFKDFVINNRKGIDVTSVEFITKIEGKEVCRNCGDVEEYHWGGSCHNQDCGCKKYVA